MKAMLADQAATPNAQALCSRTATGELRLADGTVQELAEVIGAVPYKVTSLAYDDATETLFYTSNNTTYRNLIAYDIKTGSSRMLLPEARIGDLAFNLIDELSHDAPLLRIKMEPVQLGRKLIDLLAQTGNIRYQRGKVVLFELHLSLLVIETLLCRLYLIVELVFPIDQLPLEAE